MKQYLSVIWCIVFCPDRAFAVRLFSGFLWGGGGTWILSYQFCLSKGGREVISLTRLNRYSAGCGATSYLSTLSHDAMLSKPQGERQLCRNFFAHHVICGCCEMARKDIHARNSSNPSKAVTILLFQPVDTAFCCCCWGWGGNALLSFTFICFVFWWVRVSWKTHSLKNVLTRSSAGMWSCFYARKVNVCSKVYTAARPLNSQVPQRRVAALVVKLLPPLFLTEICIFCMWPEVLLELNVTKTEEVATDFRRSQNSFALLRTLNPPRACWIEHSCQISVLWSIQAVTQERCLLDLTTLYSIKDWDERKARSERFKRFGHKCRTLGAAVPLWARIVIPVVAEISVSF